MALAAAPDLPGFRAPAPLGFGPTSTIYGAQSLELGRWVALILYSIILPDERSQRRFRRGYEVARRLGAHPHAATVLDTGLTSDRRPFIAAEIYERGTLEGRVESRQTLGVGETLRIGIALAGALETSHRAEVTHGGVHPGRVLLGADGEPALADLGVVPLVDRAGIAALVSSGPTSHHAAPEVLEGEQIDSTTDVYGLASTLYAGLTGRAPYAGTSPDDDSTPALLMRILQHAVPPIDRPDVPASLEHALRQALSCEKKDRPARPLAFARMLQECQQELGLPVTQPIVLDVAATLNLAVAVPAEPAPLPPQAAAPAPVLDIPPAPPAAPPPPPADFLAAAPPVAEALAAPPASAPERVFIPYEVPTGAPDPSAWPAPTEPPVMAPALPDSLDLAPLAPPHLAPAPPPVELPPIELAPPPHDVEPQPAHDDGADEGPGKIRALPVLVLALVVAVIFAAVTWSIVTGEAPQEERAQPGSNDNGSQPDSTGGLPRSGLTAVENANGVQLDWDDAGSGEEQVVVVLSTVDPPKTLPAETGTALLIPGDELDPASGYCFAVVPAPTGSTSDAEVAAGIPAERLAPDACIRSGSADTVLRD